MGTHSAWRIDLGAPGFQVRRFRFEGMRHPRTPVITAVTPRNYNNLSGSSGRDQRLTIVRSEVWVYPRPFAEVSVPK